MTIAHYDPSPRADNDTDLAHEQYRATDDCLQRAWEWAIDAQPDALRDRLIDLYVGTSDYDTGFEDWTVGE